MSKLDKRDFYIDGKWVPALQPNDFDVLNPATEEPVAAISMGSPEAIDKAVSTAGRAQRVASKLRAGQIHINGNDCEYGSPFGGYKMSGLGREGGRYGLEDFLEIKAVSQS